MSFVKHLQDAIVINKQRSSYYKKASKGRSVNVSRWLIALEYASLPVAAYFDARARSLNKRGIMVVKGDFVPMQVANKERPPSYQGEFAQTLLGDLKKQQSTFLEVLPDIQGKADLLKTHSLGLKQLNQWNEQEHAYEIHLAMTKHLLESLIFIVKNGLQYAESSGNESLNLTRGLISLHKQALKHTLAFDLEANSCHQLGVGILYNDLPDFPDLNLNDLS